MKVLMSVALTAIVCCPALALEPIVFKGDTHAYGPIKNWSGSEVWLKAELRSEHDTNSYGPLKDWTGTPVWIKAELGVRGRTDSYGPIKDWTGHDVWIK